MGGGLIGLVGTLSDLKLISIGNSSKKKIETFLKTCLVQITKNGNDQQRFPALQVVRDG